MGSARRSLGIALLLGAAACAAPATPAPTAPPPSPTAPPAPTPTAPAPAAGKPQVVLRNFAFRFTFRQPGTYEYFCSIHTRMRGRIVVQPPPASGTDY